MGSLVGIDVDATAWRTKATPVASPGLGTSWHSEISRSVAQRFTAPVPVSLDVVLAVYSCSAATAVKSALASKSSQPPSVPVDPRLSSSDGVLKLTRHACENSATRRVCAAAEPAPDCWGIFVQSPIMS